MMSAELKAIFKSGLGGMLAYLLVKKQMKSFRKKFDAKEHGGAPILGISRTVIKAHGSSKAKAFKSAIRQAIQYVNSGIIEDIAADALVFAEKRRAARKAEAAANEAK